jgi:hypothetical protein
MLRDVADQEWALECSRDHLYPLSRVGLDARPRAVADPSDVAQQTLLRAHERLG